MSSHGNSSSNVWDFSPYEVHRKPHEMITDKTTVAVSPRSLHSELMCPICLDLMKNAQTTKECLHRFCQECIITALRSGNKECPTCRKKLVSKRSLRPDPNFDALIAKIYPNRGDLAAQQEKSASIGGRSRMQIIPRRKKRTLHLTARNPEDSYTYGDGENSPLPSPEAKRPKLSDKEGATTFDTQPSSEVTQEPKTSTVSDTIELQMRPHPEEPAMADYAIRTLSTSSCTTIGHLSKYLSLISILNSQKGDKTIDTAVIRSLKFDLSKHQENKFIIYIQLADDYVPLPNSATLKHVTDTYWTVGEKMKLFFSLDSKIPA